MDRQTNTFDPRRPPPLRTQARRLERPQRFHDDYQTQKNYENPYPNTGGILYAPKLMSSQICQEMIVTVGLCRCAIGSSVAGRLRPASPKPAGLARLRGLVDVFESSPAGVTGIRHRLQQRQER